jgi:hypothetical protein
VTAFSPQPATEPSYAGADTETTAISGDLVIRGLAHAGELV